MKTVNVRELHARTAALVDLAAAGHVVLVLKRGRPVAELRATSGKRVIPDRRGLLARFPAVRTDSGRYLGRDRS